MIQDQETEQIEGHLSDNRKKKKKRVSIVIWTKVLGHTLNSGLSFNSTTSGVQNEALCGLALKRLKIIIPTSSPKSRLVSSKISQNSNKVFFANSIGCLQVVMLRECARKHSITRDAVKVRTAVSGPSAHILCGGRVLT